MAAIKCMPSRSSPNNLLAEMEDTVKLLSVWASFFGIRAQLALKAKGIPFQYVEEDLSNKSELLLASNPVYKKIPILIHNGRPICESRLILEYIDETWPTSPRLLPEDPYDRYLVRFWSDYKDKKTVEIAVEIGNVNFKNAEERSVGLKKVRERYVEMYTTLESGVAEMEKRDLLYSGKSLNYMDVYFAPSVPWFDPMEKIVGFKAVDCEKFPSLYRWVQNLLSNEVVKSTLPDGGKLTDYVKKRRGLE